LVLSILDDRFLLVGALSPIVLASLGWLRCPAGLRTALAALVLVVGLGVAADFHFGTPQAWNRAVQWQDAGAESQPPVVMRGLGLASSVQGLGWVRSDEQEISRARYREDLWQNISRCRFGRIAELDGRPFLGGCGNRFWWQYRGDLQAANGNGPGRLSFFGGYVWSVEDSGYGERGAAGPELLLVGDDAAGTAELLPDSIEEQDWLPLGRVSDPEAPGGVSLWARHDSDPCDTRADEKAPVIAP